MNDQLPDKTVLLVILATLILIFSLIFSLRPSQKELQPTIEWRDSQNQNTEMIQI